MNKNAPKRFAFVILSYFSISITLSVTGCSEEVRNPTLIEKLSATWACRTAVVDGVDRTSIYRDLEITFKADTYSALKGLPIFRGSGTWRPGDESGTRIIMDEVLNVGIRFIDGDLLELSLYWEDDAFQVGRKKSVKGEHVFTLIRGK